MTTIDVKAVWMTIYIKVERLNVPNSTNIMSENNTCIIVCMKITH